MPPSGRLRLVVVADTHSRPHPATAELIRREAPSHILHAGDIGELAVLDALADLAPVVAVRGNIDGRAHLPDSILVDVCQDGRRWLRSLLTHIAVRGPKLRRDARLLARQHGAALVVCGHSHVPLIAADGDLAVFNPGSVGPRRFSLPITFGVVDVAADGVSLRHVDCETGEGWQPRLDPRP